MRVAPLEEDISILVGHWTVESRSILGQRYLLHGRIGDAENGNHHYSIHNRIEALDPRVSDGDDERRRLAIHVVTS